MDPMGGIVMTNDGNCILREIQVQHPAAKSMIEDAHGPYGRDRDDKRWQLHLERDSSTTSCCKKHDRDQQNTGRGSGRRNNFGCDLSWGSPIC